MSGARSSGAGVLRVISPIDGREVARVARCNEQEARDKLAHAASAQRGWARNPLARRLRTLEAWVDAMVARREQLASELTLQMGRPIAHSPLEIDRMAERARAMIALAPRALAELHGPHTQGIRRIVQREPVGVVFVIAPWNYPYLTAVNSVVPALAAGNAVLLKHSAQTPLCAMAFERAAREAGMPEGLLQALPADHAATGAVAADPRVRLVVFTGSVAGGRAVERAAAGGLKPLAMELGGKDAAYVRADAPVEWTARELVDGAFFNAGQSCCAVERIYVHEALYTEFVEALVAAAKELRLGDPLDAATTLGPLVRASAATHVRRQVAAALAQGARRALDPAEFGDVREDSPYMAPEVLVDVDDSMDLMREETFGPAVGIAPVHDDDEAVARIDASPYGLTASVWTRDEDAAVALARRLEVGTVLVNRCDYVDPYLCWTGRKLSGYGCALGELGYHQLTQPRSIHVRPAPSGDGFTVSR